jgi:hypothetical protein
MTETPKNKIKVMSLSLLVVIGSRKKLVIISSIVCSLQSNLLVCILLCNDLLKISPLADEDHQVGVPCLAPCDTTALTNK